MKKVKEDILEKTIYCWRIQAGAGGERTFDFADVFFKKVMATIAGQGPWVSGLSACILMPYIILFCPFAQIFIIEKKKAIAVLQKLFLLEVTPLYMTAGPPKTQEPFTILRKRLLLLCWWFLTGFH